jgi:hypothetical protein
MSLHESIMLFGIRLGSHFLTSLKTWTITT